MSSPRYLIVLSEADPVARAVAERWGPLPAVGPVVDGTPLRRLSEAAVVLRRPGLHIHDDALDPLLSPVPALDPLPLVFPSIHRSESGQPCFTAHPLGNFGSEAEVGGRPRRLVPTAPRLMTAALRRLHEAGKEIGLTATFEATHHGPLLARPAFFVEIGFGEAPGPSPGAVAGLARALADLEEEPADRVVVGVGGGHYVPHLTDLALRRRWAFGHLISRHALERAAREELAEALRGTPGGEGFLFARAADAERPVLQGLAPRRRENEAPRREARGTE